MQQDGSVGSHKTMLNFPIFQDGLNYKKTRNKFKNDENSDALKKEQTIWKGNDANLRIILDHTGSLTTIPFKL